MKRRAGRRSVAWSATKRFAFQPWHIFVVARAKISKGITAHGRRSMRKLLVTVTAAAAVLLAGSTLTTQAQTSRAAGSIGAATQSFTPVEKAPLRQAACRGWAAIARQGASGPAVRADAGVVGARADALPATAVKVRTAGCMILHQVRTLAISGSSGLPAVSGSK